MRTKPTNPLFNAVAATMLTFTPAAEAQAGGPYVSITYPGLMGKSVVRTVDCSKAFIDSNGGFFLTYGLAKDIDPLGDLKNVENIELTGSERDKRNQSGTLLGETLIHFATDHHICYAQAGRHLKHTGSSDRAVAKRYGSDWEQKTNCPIGDVVKACRRELGL